MAKIQDSPAATLLALTIWLGGAALSVPAGNSPSTRVHKDVSKSRLPGQSVLYRS